MIWILRHPQAKIEMLGFIPQFLSEHDPRPAREQIDSNYEYSRGHWTPLPGMRLSERGLEYPGDPPMKLIAESRLRDERLLFFECEWLAIVQPDGTFEVSRLD